ncbi:MAG: FHA domain-containing protein [Chloroflexi bacterium]|nr:FHA domain-containing protein [Chloroflexota bacterium]
MTHFRTQGPFFRPFLNLLAAISALSLLVSSFIGVQAQGQARADLYPPDASAFPAISAQLDVFDATGVFVSGLQPGAVTVMEDGQPRPVETLTEQALPLQLVVAVNPGPPLDVRDGQGISRFQRLTQVLGGWAQARPADPADDVSLVSLSGPVISHASPTDFINSLTTFQPDFRATVPNLQSLALAIETASASTPQPGMKRAILFITPHMDDPAIESSLQPLMDRAVQNHIRVFVWFVDLETYFATTSAAAFNNLALQTGGSLFAYSGTQQFPDPEAYFAPLRRIYNFKYTSALTTGGDHTLKVDVNLPAGVVSSQEQSLALNIQPPNPILVAPPPQITRQAPADDPYNAKRLEPSEQPLQIIVEFPDGMKRSLVRSTLYVDGQVVDENTAAPFDAFTWDLTGYNSNGEHQLMVEVVDSLGLSKSTLSVPVTVTVIQPPTGIRAFFRRYIQTITIGAVGLAGLLLLFVLLTGRLRIPSMKARREARKASFDPLTQPVQIPVEISQPSEADKAKKRRTWSLGTPKAQAVDAPASLTPLTPDGQPATGNPIPLADKETTFGTDPVQASHVLDEPSISPLHARLKQTEDGGFLLADSGSVAGTWINYEPVPREGHRLEHGDVVHFGQLMYRFQLRTPPPPSQPKVTPEKPAE